MEKWRRSGGEGVGRREEAEEKGEKKRWKEGEEGAQKGKRRGEIIEYTTHVSVLI